MTTGPADITEILAAASAGDAEAANQLAPLVYAELRRRAASLMRREGSDHTLEATQLVHDAYVKLVQQERATWNDRNHFFAVASQTMRRLLVDHARGRQRRKRGGGQVKLSLDEGLGLSVESDPDVLALDDALTRLQALDARQAQLVELRFFAGLTMAEAAEVMGMSKRSAEAEWTMVSAWLRRELTSG